MSEVLMGYCGLDCEVCPVFIAKRDDDDELRLKTAREWSELYAEYIVKEGLSQDDINCTGCRSEKDIFIGCTQCPIRKCCREKEHDSCAQCNQYETCDMLNGFFSASQNQSAKANLDRIRAEYQQ